jgi:hypothetical protein
MSADQLTSRWYALRAHKEQSRLWKAQTRFRVVPSGRRSGKTEIAKRWGVREALRYTKADNGWFVFAAPTHQQARRIFWDDLKRLTPKWAQAKKPAESTMTITLINGAQISVLGMDSPERIEGRPLDWGCFDEYANMKRGVWTENVRPALSTVGREGGAWFIGVPEGRNHYYDLARQAGSGEHEDWSLHHWAAADILDPKEIAAARAELDPYTFQQEYEGSFLNFAGRAYYSFDAATHCEPMIYDPARPLALCFDFNVSPGIAVAVQELDYKGKRPEVDNRVTAIVGEVHIPRNSNTPAVCRKLVEKYGQHRHDVVVYGDATGGAAGTAKVAGSDWDLIRAHLKPVFKERLKFRVPRANPRERARVNAMNARLKAADGTIRLLVNPMTAKETVRDLEAVTVLEGGSGEIDKKADPGATHLTDALGYYVHAVHPTQKRVIVTSAV